MSSEKNFDGLYARLDDLKRCAGRGDLGISAFLSPRELYFAENYLRRTGCDFISFGGYSGAERKRIYILPEYMAELSDTEGFSDFGFSTELSVIKVNASGFVELSHRAFMGSLLSLGIEREVIGDILIVDGGALVVCDGKMSGFLLENWQRVGKDKVKLELCTLPKNFCAHREYQALSDTVASPRLDCVVAALCSLSRERARDVVESGLVELNYELEERADREVLKDSVLSVRGFGKFRILSLSDKTRKGRYRLSAEKYL